MATATYVEHKENNSTAFMVKDHSGQKNYRDSQALWWCVPAFEKIQKAFGVTERTVCPIKATCDAFNRLPEMIKAKVTLEPADFNRSREALKPEIKADANAAFMALIKLGLTEAQIKSLAKGL